MIIKLNGGIGVAVAQQVVVLLARVQIPYTSQGKR